MQKFCILEGLRCKNYAWPYFPLNSRLILQEKNNVEIMHFSLQLGCKNSAWPFFLLNSLNWNQRCRLKFCILEWLGCNNCAWPFPLNLVIHLNCNTTTYESRRNSAEFLIRAWKYAWYKEGAGLMEPLICCKIGLMRVVKRATSLFRTFCSNVSKQVARFLLPFFQNLNFSQRKQPSLLRVLAFRNISPGVSHRKKAKRQ